MAALQQRACVIASTLLTISLILLATGCTTDTAVREYPKRYFAAIDTDPLPVVEGSKLPKLPTAKETHVDGEEVSYFDNEGMIRLMQYVEAAKGNAAILDKMNEAQRAWDRERIALVMAGQSLEQERDEILRHAYDSVDTLERERKDRALERLMNRVLFLLGIAAAAVF